ncbi:prepilin-type N-terminal cleavage/methylation domain-containing protein [bacterium]|nr:MAG: prepilin-type N-terminal cleavage/methylation domain-containing protein [bacterium]
MKKAFTLIELLVVIAIIAILAAILFPVFAQAKAAAKKTECLSNVKQLGTATMMYLGDNDGFYPKRIDGTDNAEVDQWVDMIQPYVRAGASGKTSPMSKCSEYIPAVNKTIRGFGYSINSHLHSTLASESDVTMPASIALIADGVIGDFYARPGRRARIAFANSSNTSPANLNCAEQKTRHGSGTGFKLSEGGSSIAYADGHSKFQSAGFIMTRLGIFPSAPMPEDIGFFENSTGTYCVGGPSLGQ